MGTTIALEVESLTKTFRDGGGRKSVRAVDNATFHVEEGEVVGLLGPNGAGGKTTTIKCALGLMRPDSGRIRVFGEDAQAATRNTEEDECGS